MVFVVFTLTHLEKLSYFKSQALADLLECLPVDLRVPDS
jgi:hypothetical protein